jgi:hypothetical protein
MGRHLRIGMAIMAAAALGAAAVPRSLAPAAGGLWEVSKSATGHNATRVCVPSPDVLAQFEHRSGRCSRTIISDAGAETVIHYTCADGSFGRSKVKLLTPRSLSIDTQGISASYPFHYKLHARRVGDCAAR